MIAHRDPEGIVHQVEIDRDIRSHVTHNITHELGDDNARVTDHLITASPRAQRIFDELTCARCAFGNRSELDARVHDQSSGGQPRVSLSFARSTASSTLSAASPTFSLAEPPSWSARPLRFSDSLSVRSPAASFTRPFALSIFPSTEPMPNLRCSTRYSCCQLLMDCPSNTD